MAQQRAMDRQEKFHPKYFMIVSGDWSITVSKKAEGRTLYVQFGICMVS